MKEQYTLVEHSGLSGAVEWIGITANEATRVEKAGGIMFETYHAAETAEYAANYPDDDEMDGFSLYPTAKGTFSTKKLRGLRIYIPREPTKEEFWGQMNGTRKKAVL